MISDMSRPSDPNRVKLVRERLDAAGVQQHLTLIRNTGEQVELRIKGGDVAYSEASADQLADLGRQLVDGSIVAVQLRYLQDGQEWCDTLMRARKDYRLVRMRTEWPEPPTDPGSRP